MSIFFGKFKIFLEKANKLIYAEILEEDLNKAEIDHLEKITNKSFPRKGGYLYVKRWFYEDGTAVWRTEWFEV